MVTCSDQNAVSKHVMAADTIKDHTLSKKIEGDEGLNTVACLRGRLLAERQASKVAKEEAESMGNKLVELEKLLREEIKLRDKAERKLNFLKKKLESFNTTSKGKLEQSDSSEKCESFNTSSNSGQLEQSDLSEKFDNYCETSSISSASKHSEEKNLAKNPTLLENVALIQTHNGESTTKDCDSQITDCSNSNSDMGFSSQDLNNDGSRLSSLSSKSSVTENESDYGDSFDNSMALVPVNMTATSQATINQKPVNERVGEALNALKVAKERLQGSLGIRQVIPIGTN
ncbi:uncharacterized protein LOC130721492 isoform X2 [Lotus japonicus]|uniref:uncharacterized protein LOC130721492 isoform X2 n=1 Tax=Lotus japonicus TaxID=34305 RepID=UPI0025905AEE|nr:uncharacterized protein LOC130721492 isoform X2 [Lotus japonicus]